MRRVFENSVKAAHSASIARPCDGGVSELFRSCFFALAMFSRRWRENIASVPVGLLARWAKRTASRFASLTLRLRPVRARPARGSGRLIFALRAQNARPPGSLRSPSDFAPCGQSPPGVPHGLFSPCGLKTHMLQVRFAHPPTSPRAGVASPGFRMASRFAPGGRGFLSGADVENRPKRGILKLM